MVSPPLDRVFHALADPTRRAVIHRLAERPATVTELHAPFDMKLPSFLQHLRVLEASGLVRSVKVGRVRTVELRREALDEASGWLDAQRALWTRRFDALDAYLHTLKETES